MQKRQQPNARPIAGQPFRDDDPLFTVIVTDYEPSVPRDYLRRKMACLAAQTCDDFEVLVYHDGPKSCSYEEDLAGSPVHPATKFFITPERIGDWGHSARDLGIRAARGKWIIHTNADNLFYPNLIAVLKDILIDPQPWTFLTLPNTIAIPNRLKWLGKHLRNNLKLLFPDPVPVEAQSNDPEVLIYAIVMRGLVAVSIYPFRVREVAARQGIVFGGIPVRHGTIDAMQLVMKRSIWLAEGGWHDRRMDSDAMMYPKFVKKYRVLAVPAVLGEHW